MRTVKFSCECGQPIECPDEMGGQVLKCPNCEGYCTVPRSASKSGRKAKISTLVFGSFLIGVIVLVGWWIGSFIADVRKEEADLGVKSEDSVDRLKRLRAESAKVLPQAISNEVVGYTRTIRTYVDNLGNNPAEWKADATVEFVNKVGGIERTNLPFKFHVYSGQISASMDMQEIWARRDREFKATMDALQKR